MMITFQDLLKQKSPQILFENALPASDPGTLEQLKELSSRRRAIESINQNSFVTEAIAREMSGGLTSRCEQNIQKVEQYLPLLENLIHHVNLVRDNPKMVRWISDLNIRWSSALTSSSFFHLMGPKFYQMDNLHFEVAMILFVLGALVRDRAVEVLSTDLVQAASVLRKAAGVYQYLAQDVLPRLQPELALERPPEAVISVSAAMALVCLAEAQAVTVRKAEQKGNTGGLLAKLHYGICELLNEAIHTLHSATIHCKDISSCLMDYITTCKMLHELLSYKYLAESLKIEGQIGFAMGVLRHVIQNSEKHTPREESWRLVYKQLIDDLTELLRKYEHENEFVWHEKIPMNDELPIPQGVKIVSSMPYQPQRWERTIVFKI
ncbi:vacuolar-sorting protein BRO1 isoform X1 [Lycium barbarum]|uniref:vacuolar-sorting protein BRO1 isoform X1 n=2 Tax=Lycium barbarum TaxID=112863 RepID=UPI00293E283D|nr:vacuolar-sorting protein BRO1 isoform X1 [Lycium barbarum]